MELTRNILDETIRAYLAADKNYTEAGRCLGCSRTTVMRRVRKAIGQGLLEAKHLVADEGELREEITADFGSDAGLITTKSWRIHTQEKALNAAQVDTDIWEVERQKINFWEVTMGKSKSGTGRPETYTNAQVQVWLRRRRPSLEEDTLRSLIDEIPKLKPKAVQRKLPVAPFAQEIAPFDAHIGKLAWAKETGQFDYDLKIACREFLRGVERNLHLSAGYRLARIFYVLGQDLIHSENFAGTTFKSGHVLDVDSRLPKIYKTAKLATIEAIEMCRQVAPVEVIWVPGNHDKHASMFLADVIAERFRRDRWVEVDDSPNERKCRLWGNLLVGWTHDASNNKAQPTVNLLPQYWPKEWGESVFREWHTGHKHKKQEIKFAPVHTVGGVIVRQFAALSPIDAWHAEEVFTDAVPACESTLWSKDAGVPAHFTSNVIPKEQNEEAA